MDDSTPAVSRTEFLLDLSHYTEGPALDADGNLYVTNLTGGEMLKIDPAGTVTPWARATCPNGQVVLPNGEHLVCDSQLQAVSRFSDSGKLVRHEFRGQCAGLPVQTPNDLVVDSAGGVYFTDSVRHAGRVFYVAPNGKQRVVAAELDYPNGLVLSADETRLFVAESYQNQVRAIDLREPGVAQSPAMVFALLPRHESGLPVDNLPDGLALDKQGRLWIAHYGMQAIQVLSPVGEVLHSIATPMPLVSNLILVNETERGVSLFVTGGYGEPGPGAVLKLRVDKRLIRP